MSFYESLLPKGFQSKSNFAYNPTSGSTMFRDKSGQMMLDAPYLSSPQAFGGTKFGGQVTGGKAPAPSQSSGISVTSSAGSSNSSSNTSPTQPDYYTSQMDLERQRLEEQRRQREEDNRRYSEQRDQDYQRGLQTQLDTLGSRLGGYGINDVSAINAALGQLDMLGNQASSYSSDTSSGLSLRGGDQYRSQLQDLLARRDAEQQRFDDFSRGINTNLSNFGDYTVNSDLDEAEQALRRMLLEAQNYRTDLDVDLRSPQSQIQFAIEDIDRLGQERTRQQGIIDDARRQSEQNLTNFGRSYTDVDYRNMQALDNLTRQLDDITNPNLNVDLNYDFSDLASQTDPYRDVVQNLRDRRMRDLNALGEDIGGIGASLEGFYGTDPVAVPGADVQRAPFDPMVITQNEDGTIIDTLNGLINDKPTPGAAQRRGQLNALDSEMGLGGNGFLHPVLKAPDDRYAYENEGRRPLRDISSASEVYDIRDRLNDALNNLDAYGTGERANELRQQLFNQDETYSQLADQLRDRQGQIESDAQAQLDELANARLSRPDDIRNFEQALKDLTGQRDLFDASVAADELQRLTDQITSRRSDLERDEAARIARQELERRRAMQRQGGGTFNNQFMSPEDYSAYLRALELGRDDDYYANMGTGFSRALGLG